MNNKRRRQIISASDYKQVAAATATLVVPFGCSSRRGCCCWCQFGRLDCRTVVVLFTFIIARRRSIYISIWLIWNEPSRWQQQQQNSEILAIAAWLFSWQLDTSGLCEGCGFSRIRFAVDIIVGDGGSDGDDLLSAPTTTSGRDKMNHSFAAKLVSKPRQVRP